MMLGIVMHYGRENECPVSPFVVLYVVVRCKYIKEASTRYSASSIVIFNCDSSFRFSSKLYDVNNEK